MLSPFERRARVSFLAVAAAAAAFALAIVVLESSSPAPYYGKPVTGQLDVTRRLKSR